MWVLLELPRFGGANHASGYHHRSRHCQVGLSGARHRHESKVLIRCQLKQTPVINAIRAHLAEFPLCQDPRHPASALAYGNDATYAEAICAPEHPA